MPCVMCSEVRGAWCKELIFIVFILTIKILPDKVLFFEAIREMCFK